MDYFSNSDSTLKTKFLSLNWKIISLVLVLSAIGLAMLYSAGSGNVKPWMIRQLSFYLMFLPVMFIIALVDIRIWYKLAYPMYLFGVFLLFLVAIMGHNALGATRWFRIAGMNIQPSEIMKVFTVIALARYFYDAEMEEISKTRFVLIPLAIIAFPALLIFKQPDLGTALILIVVGVIVSFSAGVKKRNFLATGILGLAAVPVIWIFVLYDYQKRRVLTFLNLENDPLGSGYNIMQSKIAIGSGGVTGKGYLLGTQGQLNFLPEKQTDFIFTMLAEEAGFLGAITTIAIYCLLIFFGTVSAMRTNHQFGKLLIIGIINILFIHMFVNIGMTSGLIPVVGAPLPFISYGGTITATMLIGFGFLLNSDLYRNIPKLK